ncbi:MAG: thioredoxin protein [Planctomycetaceae bacterium]|nr:thioredoxin protein [Planctomycetaceae bacterium]
MKSSSTASHGVPRSGLYWLVLNVVLLGLLTAGCDLSAPKADNPPDMHPGADSPTAKKTGSASAIPERPAGVLPFFTEIAESIGVKFTRNDDIRGLHRILEANGGGVALSDFDNDGWPDLFFTNGCRLPLREGAASDSNSFFRNRGPAGFDEVAEAAGLQGSGYWQGCTCGDFNADGFEDLYVAAFGKNVFFCNQGDGTFRDVTAETGTAVGRWSSSPAFADLNLDGHLDLFVVTYVEAKDDPPALCPEPASSDGYIQCSPTMFQASEDVLFLGDGQGGFTNVTQAAGVAGIDGKGLGIAIFDSDGDHLPDIFIANDGTPNFLYCRTAQAAASGKTGVAAIPKFVDQAFEKGVAISQNGKAQAGMGVAVADVDGDGWLDIFVTNFFGEPNSLYRNHGGQQFEDASASSGLGPPSRPVLGFGAEFLDIENDGWPDLFVTNGHVDDLTSFTSVPYRMPPLVFRSQHNGTFLNVTPWAGSYCQNDWLGRGLATSDIDRDGKLDIVVSHQRAASAVLHNKTQGSGASCRMRLIGTGMSNRSAFHASVHITGIDGPPIRQIIGGGSFQSASDRTVHIGMGKSRTIPEIAIRWPDGRIEKHQNLSSGQFVLVQGRSPLKLQSD